MRRAYYSNSIDAFLVTAPETILGVLTHNSDFAVGLEQRDAWLAEIRILQGALAGFTGAIYFEYSIPRMGRRIDVVLLIGPVIFVLEFKHGEKEFTAGALDQVSDYALDLKNFHETSHEQFIAPVLIATAARAADAVIRATPHNDKLLFAIKSTVALLRDVLKDVLRFVDGPAIDRTWRENGHYRPTPTIVEAAIALYNGHSVEDISRRDASAKNLTVTTEAISAIIRDSKEHSRKSICFVTGVPGAGKTLVGLNIATTHMDKKSELYSVFLSGNGPLVAILREALARDKVRRARELGQRVRKGEVLGEVKAVIQNIHHFRDEYLVDSEAPPEHVALFDEAQRAWNLERTSSFMRRKKKRANFNQSEPEFLISCFDRHRDWAVIVCLVGGGQEINTGEAGINEWAESLERSFGHWHVYLSSRLTDSEYRAAELLEKLGRRANVFYKDELHLAVSMRSFRAENVSLLVKQLLDCELEQARWTYQKVKGKYPIVITRDLGRAKRWLREKARGTERYGIVVSSQAERLRPHAINVRAPMDPICWFLNGKEDTRSSYYLEDVATEFHVQGLELDWACVTWDADFRYTAAGWEHWSFCGDRWRRINKAERKQYLKNAYRVLLTRARQGMVIVVPTGDGEDVTRLPKFYDATFEYLRSIGFQEI